MNSKRAASRKSKASEPLDDEKNKTHFVSHYFASAAGATLVSLPSVERRCRGSGDSGERSGSDSAQRGQRQSDGDKMANQLVTYTQRLEVHQAS